MAIPQKCKQRADFGLPEAKYLEHLPTEMVESINIRISLGVILLFSCVTYPEGTKSL